ncbi:MAG: hypothetical protein ACRD2D_07115, partial [Terriglobales bacterium]
MTGAPPSCPWRICPERTCTARRKKSQCAALLVYLFLSAGLFAQQPPKPPEPAKPHEPHRQTYERKSLVNVSNTRRVNVAQLEEALRESHGRSDRQIAKQLARLGLTERFSLARVAQGQSRLPGKRSRQALALLADAAAFLP